MDRLNNHNVFRKFNHWQQYNFTFPYFKLLVYSDNEPSSYTFCTSALIRSPSCRYFLIMCSSSKDLLRYTWPKNKLIKIGTEYNGIHQKDSAMQDFLIYLHSCITSNVLMQDWAGLTTAGEAASSVALQQWCHLLYSGQSHDKKISYTIQKVNVQCGINCCGCCTFISPAAGPQISATNFTLYRLVHFKQDILVYWHASSHTCMLFTNSPPGKLTEDKSKTESSLEFVSTFHRFCWTSVILPTITSPTSPL